MNLIFYTWKVRVTFYYNFSIKTYHKTACTSLREDEHLDVRNMSETVGALPLVSGVHKLLMERLPDHLCN